MPEAFIPSITVLQAKAQGAQEFQAKLVAELHKHAELHDKLAGKHWDNKCPEAASYCLHIANHTRYIAEWVRRFTFEPPKEEVKEPPADPRH